MTLEDLTYVGFKDLDLLAGKPRGYFGHPKRTDETDDALLDAVNQLELSVVDLSDWAYSFKAIEFMDTWADYEVTAGDFMEALKGFSA
jgi:hypothetical protein